MFTKLKNFPVAILGKKINEIEQEADVHKKKRRIVIGKQKDKVFPKTLAHCPCMVAA
jgi:hypothetical protein